MELAAALHHSAQRPKTVVDEPKEEVENVTRDGLRAQKSPPPGVRPGSLLDPGPQRSDRTVRHFAGEAPLLVVAPLAGGDEVDATTVSFLLRENLLLQKSKEEEKERKWRERRKVLKAEFVALMALQSLTPLQLSRSRELVEALEVHDACKPSSGSSRRKRKKRKKRRLRHGGRRPGGHAAHVPAVLQVPGFQFLVRVLDIPVMPQRRIRCAVLGLVVTRPLLRNGGRRSCAFRSSAMLGTTVVHEIHPLSTTDPADRRVRIHLHK